MKTCRIQPCILILGMHRKSAVPLNVARQLVGVSRVSRDSCISTAAGRSDATRCNCGSALTPAAVKLLEKHSATGCVHATHVYPSINIRAFSLFSCLLHFEGLGAKPAFPTSSHNVSPGQRRPWRTTAVPALNATTASGDKRVVVSLQREHFQQENVTLTGSTAFIFHVDRLKDAIKKRSNLLVQVRGGSRSYFLIKRRKKCFKAIWLGERCGYICLQEGFKCIAECFVCLVSSSPPPKCACGISLVCTFNFIPSVSLHSFHLQMALWSREENDCEIMSPM